ncbi:MAG: hypothetical protein L6R42_010536 [Xanthoria sp. 1 TBL-2021]|nr:MAG: hypothetical protein L6R42_010536 [Xanthoria sp. 1 TBL-2021]
MLAVQVVQYNKPYAFNDIPTPTALSEYDLLLKVKVASLCHTDGMVSAGDFSTKLPCTASHEGYGEVVAWGSSVKDFKKGDRVMAAIPFHRCGHCPDCLGPEEFHHYCPNLRAILVLPLMALSLTMACAGITIWGGLVNAGLKAGETVALVGAGGGLGRKSVLGVTFPQKSPSRRL